MKLNYNFEERLEIKKRYKSWKPGSSPYVYSDWSKMTPIENNVWADIRYLCLPFYPQYPVGKYFVDFADPIRKIAIEVDGRQHEQLEFMARDKQREQELTKLGWSIYRIPGRGNLPRGDTSSFVGNFEYL